MLCSGKTHDDVNVFSAIARAVVGLSAGHIPWSARRPASTPSCRSVRRRTGPRSKTERAKTNRMRSKKYIYELKTQCSDCCVRQVRATETDEVRSLQMFELKTQYSDYCVRVLSASSRNI